MSVEQWARLQSPARCGLRLGAWYSVVTLTAREAQLKVHGRLATLPRSLLEFRMTPPREWTVVRGPLSASRVPAGAREGYLVCPNCRYRDLLPGDRTPTARCPRCNQVFAVRWDEQYPRTTPDGRPRSLGGPQAGAPRPADVGRADTLAPDHRAARRRRSVERRSGRERRGAERRVMRMAAPIERRTAERRQLRDRRTTRERRASERRRRVTIW